MGATDSIAPIRWFGSKWSIADWIVAHLPTHRSYVEVFGGSAAVLLTEKRSHSETYNDLHDDVVHFFRLLRDRPDELIIACELTPFSREEHVACFVESGEEDEIERARRFFIRSWQTRGGYQRSGATKGFWADPGADPGARRGSPPAITYARVPARLRIVAERLQGVCIESLDWRELLAMYDREDTLFYCDPPYMRATRYHARVYDHEWTDDEHADFLAQACALEHAACAISGYRTDIYDEALSAWLRLECGLTTQTGTRRTECLWLSPRAAEGGTQRVLGYEYGGAP